MTSSNSFTLEVLADGSKPFVREGFPYVSIAHKSNFKLRLSNARGAPADAQVTIEGVDNGLFRVPAYGSITIERPSGKPNLFVALVEETSDASSAGVRTGDRDNGLISVVFTPERAKTERQCYSSYSSSSSSPPAASSATSGFISSSFIDIATFDEEEKYTYGGSTLESCSRQSERFKDNDRGHLEKYKGVGIALGDHSSQSFNQVSKITDIDHANVTTIKVRLVSPAEPLYTSIRNSGDLSRPAPSSPPRLG